MFVVSSCLQHISLPPAAWSLRPHCPLPVNFTFPFAFATAVGFDLVFVLDSVFAFARCLGLASAKSVFCLQLQCFHKNTQSAALFVVHACIICSYFSALSNALGLLATSSYYPGDRNHLGHQSLLLTDRRFVCQSLLLAAIG